jgi:cobalt-zinc-cadmium efflux system outer membrane protein
VEDEVKEPDGKAITLRQAAALALVRNPDLATFGWNLRIAEARILQAGLKPNPELSFEVEDLRWNETDASRSESWTLGSEGLGYERSRESGAGPGLENAELTVSLSQAIELGGKRLKRVRLAEADRELVRWNYEAARVDVLSRVAEAFVAVLGAQERLRLQEESIVLAEKVSEAIRLRVEAGKASPLEFTRAETELESVRIERDAAARDVDAARAMLAATYGAASPEFEHVAGTLEEAVAPPSLDALVAAVAKSPELLRWSDEMSQRLAALEVERSKRIPDLTLAAGLRTRGSEGSRSRGWGVAANGTGGSLEVGKGDSALERERENSVLVSATVALPVFNRNQGAILEAQHGVEQAKAQQTAAELRIRSELFAAYQNLQKAAESAKRLREQILPRAQDTFERTQEGYRQGKFGFLEVLTAQRTLFDVRRQYTDTLIDYHGALVNVERLIGQPLSALGGELPTAETSLGGNEHE